MTMNEFARILRELEALREQVGKLSVSLASCQSASGARMAYRAGRAVWISTGAAVVAAGAALLQRIFH
jgi:membrane-bound inhibitor of C-type lysozyme